MKVVVEKEEADIVQFEKEKEYIVLKNYDVRYLLGFAKISLENGIMYADLNLKESVKGYPAIGFIKDLNTNIFRLKEIAICDSPNIDGTIELIEYAKTN